MLVNDAYKVISAIVATKVGREAFIASRGMRVLSLLNIRQVSCDWRTAGHVTSVLTADCFLHWEGLWLGVLSAAHR